MIRFTTLCGLLLALATPAGAQDKKDVPKDLVPFQGTWKPVKAEFGGMAVPDKEREAVRFKFDGDKMIVREGKKDKDEAGSFSVDSKKNPAEIDAVSPKGEKVQGIYKFDKDGKMTLAFSKGKGAARPKAFDSEGGVLLVLEKVKE